MQAKVYYRGKKIEKIVPFDNKENINNISTPQNTRSLYFDISFYSTKDQKYYYEVQYSAVFIRKMISIS